MLGSNLTNTGSILADTPGQNVSTIEPGGSSVVTLVNQGLIQVDNGATLQILTQWDNSQGTIRLGAGRLELGGSYTTAALNGIQRTGGIIGLQGSLDNTGQTLTIDAGLHNDVFDGVAVTGGKLRSGDGTAAHFALGDNTLAGVDQNLDLNVDHGVTLHLTGGTQTVAARSITLGTGPAGGGPATLDLTALTELHGNLLFTGGTTVNQVQLGNGAFTIAADGTVATHGGSGTIGSTTTGSQVVNEGTISAETPQNSIVVWGATQNLGTLQATNGGLLEVKDLTGDAGNLMVDGGHLSLNTAASDSYTLNQDVNVGDTSWLTLRGAWSNTASLNVNGGTLGIEQVPTGNGTLSIQNATLRLLGPFTLRPVQNLGAQNTLVVVANQGSLDLQQKTVTRGSGSLDFALDGGTISNGTIAVSDSSVPAMHVGGNSALQYVRLQSGLLLDSSATLSLTDVQLINATVNGGTGSKLTVAEQSGTLFSGGTVNVNILAPQTTALELTNGLTLNGTLSIAGPGSGYTGPQVTFVGDQTLGGTGSIVTSSSFSNTATKHLKIQNGTLTLGPDFTFIASRRSTDVIDADNGQLINQGLIDVARRSSLTINTPFTNQGTLNVEGQFVLTSGAMSNSGSITGSGTLNLNGAALINDGQISPGNSPGTLTVNGDFTQDPQATLLMQIAGTTPSLYDRLIVQGKLNLNGQLLVTLLHGFTPTAGEQFDLLDFTSSQLTGTFADVTLPVLPNGLQWQENALYTQGVISVTGTPEPASFVLLGLLALMLFTRTTRPRRV